MDLLCQRPQMIFRTIALLSRVLLEQRDDAFGAADGGNDRLGAAGRACARAARLSRCRNVDLLAGLAAILGVVIAAVLMADALTRPLVEMADAVTTLARARTAELADADNAPRTNVVALEPYAQRRRTFGAAATPARSHPVRYESYEPRDGGGASGTQVVERLRKRTPAPAIGSTIDIIIPSDRREQPN